MFDFTSTSETCKINYTFNQDLKGALLHQTKNDTLTKHILNKSNCSGGQPGNYFMSPEDHPDQTYCSYCTQHCGVGTSFVVRNQHFEKDKTHSCCCEHC